MNDMKLVHCPVNKLAPTWANSVTKSRNTIYRCTKCGTAGHDVCKVQEQK